MEEKARRTACSFGFGGSGSTRLNRHTSKEYEFFERSMTSCSSRPRSGMPSTEAIVSPSWKYPCTSAAPPGTILTTVLVASSSSPSPLGPRWSRMKSSCLLMLGVGGSGLDSPSPPEAIFVTALTAFEKRSKLIDRLTGFFTGESSTPAAARISLADFFSNTSPAAFFSGRLLLFDHENVRFTSDIFLYLSLATYACARWPRQTACSFCAARNSSAPLLSCTIAARLSDI